jgi:hypothetical protein
VTALRLWVQDLCASSTWICRKFREQQLRERVQGPPFVHLSRPQSSQLFLFYSGMDAYYSGQQICSMGLLKFLQVSGLGSRNLTWIRDPFFNNYAGGFGPDVPDLASLENWHRQHLAGLPHVREIYTIGYSSGAYGALLFGHLLGAKKAWAFSPRTADWETDVQAKAALRERLRQSNGVTQYDVWHAHRNRLDREFADQIRDCPGVTVHAHPKYGATHFLLDRMILSGEFQSLLPTDTRMAGVTSPSLAGG